MPEFVFRFGSDAAGRTVNVYDQSGQQVHAGTTGSAVDGEVEYTATLTSGIYVGEVKTAVGWVRAAGFLDATTAELSATYVARLEPSSYTYNSDGTVATETAGGLTTTYTYNADGSVNTATRGGGATLTFSYNSDGTVSGVA